MIRIRGTRGDDTIVATQPDRYQISGSSGFDTIVGGNDRDSLYGGTDDDRLFGRGGDDYLQGDEGEDFIDGGSGEDTAGYVNADSGVSVSLATGKGYAGEAKGDVLRDIENLRGSNYDDKLGGDNQDNVLEGLRGDDVLLGEGGNDDLWGGYGADMLIGGSGIDSAHYLDSNEGVYVDLESNGAKGGTAEGDTFDSIENVFGSRYGDRLIGDDGANTLDGGLGDDLLQGNGGADMLFGGSGEDTARYSTSDSGVTVDLTTGVGSGGDAQGDLLHGIENLIGSRYADNLTGDANDNELVGGHGDDTLMGMDGDDTLVGGAGADDLDGGAGLNDTADYSASNAGVTIDLVAGTGQGGHAEGDTLSGIENIVGSRFDDVIVGNGAHSEIDAGAGDDIIHGGTGLDGIIGGSGDDTFVFDAGDVATGLLPWNIDFIMDFTAGGTEDSIDLSSSGTGFNSLADVLDNSEEMYVDGVFGTMIDMGAIGGAFLVDVSMSELTADDFTFA